MKHPQNPIDIGWLAGVVSAFGNFSITGIENPHLTLNIASRRMPHMVYKFAGLVNAPVNVRPKQGHIVKVNHYTLKQLWSIINQHVTIDRVAEYDSLVAECKRRRQEWLDKQEYQAERAAAPRSTPDQLRRRSEALYHNQDAAIQIVDGFVQADMATAYDLEQAQRRRERGE